MTLLPLFLLGTVSGLNDFNAEVAGTDAERGRELESALREGIKEIGVPGGTAAIAIDGRLVAVAAAGIRMVGSTVTLKADDPMHTGSNTKGMTAMLVSRLVQQRVLDWNMTLARAFPRMASMRPEFQDLPLIELAYQRSGIDDVEPGRMEDLTRLPVEQARAAYTERMLAAEPPEEPGTTFEYRNGNYVILGAAIEEATGRTWEEVMRSEVFKPLHMRRAGFGPMGTGKGIVVPYQHAVIEGKMRPVYADNPPMVGPAGTVHCSVLDLLNYAQTWVNGPTGDGEYLTPALWRRMETPPPGSRYGTGVVEGDETTEGVRDLGHHGSNTFSTSEWRVRKHGRLVMATMFNAYSRTNEKLTDRIEELGAKWVDATPKPAAPQTELGEDLLAGIAPIRLLDGRAEGKLVKKPEGYRFDTVRTDEYPFQAAMAFLCPALKDGKKYALLFDAMAPARRKVGIAVEQGDRPHDNCGLEEKFEVGTEWKAYRFVFTASGLAGAVTRAPIFSLGEETGSFWCRNVRLCEVKD